MKYFSCVIIVVEFHFVNTRPVPEPLIVTAVGNRVHGLSGVLLC